MKSFLDKLGDLALIIVFLVAIAAVVFLVIGIDFEE